MVFWKKLGTIACQVQGFIQCNWFYRRTQLECSKHYALCDSQKFNQYTNEILTEINNIKNCKIKSKIYPYLKGLISKWIYLGIILVRAFNKVKLEQHYPKLLRLESVSNVGRKPAVSFRVNPPLSFFSTPFLSSFPFLKHIQPPIKD